MRTWKTLTEPLGVLALGATSLFLDASCSELSAIDIGRCGNNVLDRGEDCDGFDHTEGTRCGSARDGAKACRYACDPLCHEGDDCSSEDLCPSGYGCGVDGICRKPEGFAQTFTELGFVSALWVDVADLNRDGVDDIALLDSTGVRVETLSVDVGSRHTDRFQLTPVGRPAIADVDGDGLLDVLAPDADGLTVLRGSSDGDLSPSLYPGIDLPLESFAYFPNDIIPTRTDTTPTWAGDEGMAMVELAPSPELPDGMTGFVHLSTTDAFLVPADLPRSPGDVLGRVAVGQLDPSSYASEAAVAFCDDVALHLYTFQAVDPDAVLPVLASHDTVALANGSRTVACPSEGNASDYGEPFGVRLVQANPPVASDGSSALCCDVDCTSLAPGDDHPDLLVITDAGHQIAFGLGDGTFHDEACELAGPVVPSQSASVHPELGSCLLLAVGQLDGDGRLDVVAPNGLWLSELRPVDEVVCDASGGSLPAVGPAESWYEATTADVNGDGHRDVVALSPSRGDVDVLLGTTGSVISRRLLPNLTPGRSLRPGDFDGDGVDDIAFVLAGAALLPGSDRLATIWGEAGSGPSEVTVLGTVPLVAELAVTRTPPSNAVAVDAYDDLLVATLDQPLKPDGQPDAPIGIRLGLATGRPDRELSLPFVVTTPAGLTSTRWQTLGVTSGAFAFGEASASGLVAVVRYAGGPAQAPDEELPQIAALELAPPTSAGSDARTEPQLRGELAPLDILGGHQPLESPHLIAVDLDGSGVEHPVIFSFDLGRQGTRIHAPRATTEGWVVPAAAEIADASPIGNPNDDAVGDDFDVEEILVYAYNSPQRCRFTPGQGDHVVMGMVEDRPSAPVVGFGGLTFSSATRSVAHVHSPQDLLALQSGSGTLSPQVMATERGFISGVACLDDDGDGDDELFVATLYLEAEPNGPVSARLYLERSRYEGGSLQPLEVVAAFDGDTWAPLRDLSQSGIPIQGIAAGDLDGDGVQDLLFGALFNTVALLGKAHNP